MMAAANIYAVLCSVLVLSAGRLQGVAGQCSTTDTSAQAVEDCVNAVRANSAQYADDMCGAADPVPPLRRDGALTRAAEGHSADMAANNFFAHGDFGGRIRNEGFTGGRIAENIAQGYRSAFAVVAGWMCSSGHRRNLLSCNYDSIGTGVDCSTGRCYYTQTYGCSGRNCCSGGSGPPAPAPNPTPDPTPAPDPPATPDPGPTPDPPPPEDPAPTPDNGGPAPPPRVDSDTPDTFQDWWRRIFGQPSTPTPEPQPVAVPAPGPAPGSPQASNPTRWYWRSGSGSGSRSGSSSGSGCIFRWACPTYG